MVNRKVLTIIGSICFALVLVMLPLMAACGPTPTPEPEEEIDILIAGGSVGGTYYPLAVGYMTIFNQFVPGVRATALSVGSSSVHVRMVDSGEMFMGMCPYARAREAYHGGTEDWPEAMKINWVSSTYGSWAHFSTLDKNIKTLYDLKGKKVALGDPAGTTPLVGEAILKGIGFEKDVDYDAVMLGEGEAAEALKDGRADVMFTASSKAGAAIVELTTAKDVYFIPIPEDKMDAIVPLLDEYGVTRPKGVLPAGTFKGMDKDYPTFVTPSCIIVRPDADEELVYAFTKALWENIETLGEVTAAGKEFDINDVKTINFGIPLHPAALKYYKEVGVLTEDPYKG